MSCHQKGNFGPKLALLWPMSAQKRTHTKYMSIKCLICLWNALNWSEQALIWLVNLIHHNNIYSICNLVFFWRMYNNSTDFQVTVLNVNFVLRFWNLKCFYSSSKPVQRAAYLMSRVVSIHSIHCPLYPLYPLWKLYLVQMWLMHTNIWHQIWIVVGIFS